MRRSPLLAVVVLLFTVANPARAQFCPGVSPWVFDDVAAADPFCGYITWMAQNGITLGCQVIDANHRLYCPNANVTRAGMAAFMNRLGDLRVEAVGTGPGLTGGPITGVGTINLAATQLLPTIACTNNQIARWNGSAWVCSTDSNSGGTVTSVATGAGLTGGPITSSGTIAADTAYLQRRVSASCVVGSSIRAIAADGTVTCQPDANSGGTVTSVAAAGGGGLETLPAGGIVASGSVAITAGGVQTSMLADGAVTGTKIAAGTITPDRLAVSQQLPDCLDGQAIRRSGGAWICGNLPPVITTIDASNDVGRFTSLAIGTDGFPVVSYYDVTNGDLKVAKCLNATCSGGTSITPVDTAGLVGVYTSIVVGLDGFPVVSYFDGTNADLKVAKCLNAACTGGATITTVDSAGDVGRYTSIAIGTDGFPVVSYYYATGGDLKVAKCVNAACTGLATITTVDSTGDVGQYTSIAIGTDGFPVVSYFDVTNTNLKVAKCVNAACTGSSTLTTVDNAGYVGDYTSIAIGADGFPVVSYDDSTNSDLKVAKCVNAACTGGATITTVDSSGSTGSLGTHTSIAVGADGFPVVSYFDFINSHLKVAKCANPSCTGTATITTVDTSYSVGIYTSIKIGADGFPVVSYMDAWNADLKVLKCSNASCVGP